MPAAAAAKSLQSCPTLWDPIDSSPPGSPVPGILQERTLEWVAISFSDAWKWKVKVKSLSRVWLLATPWTAVPQAPPSMGFSRQEYWSGVPLPSLQCLLDILKYFVFLLSLSVMCDSLWLPWAVALEAPLLMELPKQEYWNGLPFPPPGGASQPRNRTYICCFSCFGRQIIYHWATWEATSNTLTYVIWKKVVLFCKSLGYIQSSAPIEICSVWGKLSN